MYAVFVLMFLFHQITRATNSNNICQAATCPGNSYCVEGINSYTCRCLPGDDCIKMNCSDSGICTCTSSSNFTCYYFDGYSEQEYAVRLRFDNCLNCKTSEKCLCECMPEYTSTILDERRNGSYICQCSRVSESLSDGGSEPQSHHYEVIIATVIVAVVVVTAATGIIQNCQPRIPHHMMPRQATATSEGP